SAAAGSARDGGATASIAWVGYDAPAAKGRLRGLTLAGAREGAHLLLRDIASITASRSARAEDGARPRHTVLAHDYGVDVTEAAGRAGRLAGLADDIVLAGRPDDSRVLAHRFGDEVRVHAAAGGGPLYRTIGAQVPDGARPPGGVPTEALYRMEAVVAGHVGAAPHRPPDTGAAAPERPALRRNNCVEPAMWRVAAQTGNPTLATPEPGSVGPEGVSWRQVQDMTGGELTPVAGGRGRSAHQAIAEGLAHLGGRSTVLVVDQSASVDEHGVGAHAYVMYFDSDTGRVMVDDPLRGDPFVFDPD